MGIQWSSESPSETEKRNAAAVNLQAAYRGKVARSQTKSLAEEAQMQSSEGSKDSSSATNAEPAVAGGPSSVEAAKPADVSDESKAPAANTDSKPAESEAQPAPAAVIAEEEAKLMAEKDAAAVKLQAVYSGKQVRSEVNKLKEDSRKITSAALESDEKKPDETVASEVPVVASNAEEKVAASTQTSPRKEALPEQSAEDVSDESKAPAAITDSKPAESEAQGLRCAIDEEKANFQQVEESLVKQVNAVEREIVVQLENQSNRFCAKQRQKLDDAIDALGDKLNSEKEARKADNVAANNKHILLLQEKDDLQARLERDIAQLMTQLGAAKGALATERQTWADERMTLVRRYEDAVRSQRSTDTAFKNTQAELTETLTQLSALETENKALEKKVTGHA